MQKSRYTGEKSRFASLLKIPVLFDFIFIDANKKDYIKYFELADQMLKNGGIILADNILSHYEKVEDYVDNLFNLPNYQSQILDLGTGMMLSRRI